MLVATKGGHLRPGDGRWTLNGRPEYLKQAARGVGASGSASRRSGSTSSTGRTRRSPYAESVGALRDLLDDGVIRMAGISNATVEQIRQANEILGGRLVSVQNQFSPAFRSSQRRARACARSSASRSCRGARSAASRNAGELGASTRAFARSARRTA